MRTRTRNEKTESVKKGSGISFAMIKIMHDNPLLSRLRDPFAILKTAGLKKGQCVLEVGCGPGFFTIPAARIVGDEGLIYALDVNPRAIQSVQAKIRQTGISNVRPMQTNASRSGLADACIDAAFLFGLPYIAGGFDELLVELRRLLKPGGCLAIQKRLRAGADFIEKIQAAGFVFTGQNKRILTFTRSHEQQHE